MGQAREALAAVAAGKPLPAGLGETVAVVPPWQSGAPTQAVVTKAVAAPPVPPRPHTPPRQPVAQPSMTRVDSRPPVTSAPKPTRVAEIAPVPATNGRPAAPTHQDPPPPPPRRPAAAPRPAAPAPAPKPRRSGLVYLALLLVAGVAGVLIATSLMNRTNSTGADPGTSGGKGNQTATHAPTPSSSSKSPKVNEGPSGSPAQAVQDFYAAVPDTEILRSKLSVRGKAAYTEQGELSFLAGLKKAEIIDGPHPMGDGRYSVLVRFIKKDNSSENRRMYHPVIAAPEGSGYLVDNFRWSGNT
ncbi:hypothetical protein SAMN05444320_1011 [Streptoalloteichus hindustanus]|uniref:Uncharacterized protein n=1 Tax=Streptoalloteichus hindustanus TaxID=2017 RepID=A0A1M4T781_STRHI|nr:hypothetical protein SAMN05444320_1011 [Streptoalloteichus hindustanus]